MTKPKRDWTKIKYYPVSIEKLQNATMREAAYLIAPVNIGEDYEYFDEVKHLLEIPAKIFDAERPRKSIEEIQQELDEKIDALIKTTKEKFEYSKISSEKRYKYEFDKIFERFEYAKQHGEFRPKLTIGTSGSYLISGPSGDLNWVTSNFIIKPDANDVGYYEIAPNTQFWMKKKPNFIVRNCAKILLDIIWKDA